MKIYIMRHGETNWNRERRFQGTSDIPLNEEGKEMAVITEEKSHDIHVDRIYCSPLTRARETAAIMNRNRKLEIGLDERLIEVSFGVEEGIQIDEARTNKESRVYNFLQNPANYIPPEKGESIADIRERCQSFIEEVLLPLENECDGVLLVSHGAYIRVMVAIVCGYPDSELWDRVEHHNCSITSFSLENGKLALIEEAKKYW